MKTVQIFGVKNPQATRAAERFFKEAPGAGPVRGAQGEADGAGRNRAFHRPFRTGCPPRHLGQTLRQRGPEIHEDD